MHTYTNVEVCGTKACKKLKHILVDTGASFTSITVEDAREIGVKEELSVDVNTATGKIEENVGIAVIKLMGKKVPNAVVISATGNRVIGVNTLETMFLRVDSIKGKLEDLGPFLA